MQVILTEEQLGYVIEEGRIAQFLSNLFSNTKSEDDLREKVKKAIAYGIAISSIISAIAIINFPENEKQEVIQELETRHLDPHFDEKVSACRKYMEYALGNKGLTLDSTKMTPEALVTAAYEKAFDLPLLIAVAHLESNFATGERAQRTNSAFSVGAYDNGTDRAKYNHPDESIEPYIDLINSDYIKKGESILDLLVPGKFVNHEGKRYAKNPDYEKNVAKVRNRIIKMFPILEK